MLAKLRPVITLGEFELVYNISTGFSTLIVWFVDPDLDPGASGDEIAQNASLAMRHAAELSHQLNAADPCLQELSAAINPVVVDREYNGWFAGLITPSTLPGDTKLTDAQLAELTGAFEISYLRDRPAPPMEPAPGGSCSWPEARSGIQWHWEVSGPAPSNIGAWLSIDESGVTVTAQWPGVSGEWAEYAVPTFMAGTINVTMELHCLHPQPDLLVLLVVDDAGKVEIVGVWSGEAMRAEDLSQLRYRQLEN
jgi:hypothetical protein